MYTNNPLLNLCVLAIIITGFERRTGWRLRSKYEPLAKDTADFLNDFYDYQNRLLFHQLGENFTLGLDW